MLRTIAIYFAIAVMPFGVGTAQLAYAEPSDETGTCTWVPIAPAVVDISGTKMVAAAVKRGPCTMLGVPTQTTVCLAIQGDGSAGTCGDTTTSDPARATYRYVPGATYVMTGRGCVVRPTAPNTLCQTLGPFLYPM